MTLLNPDWNKKKPTPLRARAMCIRVPLEQSLVTEVSLVSVVEELSGSHIHGGAFLAAFKVGPSSDFDWFASRNRLLEFDILRLLLARREIRDALPALQIQIFLLRKTLRLLAQSRVRAALKWTTRFHSMGSYRKSSSMGALMDAAFMEMEGPRKKRRCASATPHLV